MAGGSRPGGWDGIVVPPEKYPGQAEIRRRVRKARRLARIGELESLAKVDQAFYRQVLAPVSWVDTDPAIRQAALLFVRTGRELWLDMPVFERQQAEVELRHGSRLARTRWGAVVVLAMVWLVPGIWSWQAISYVREGERRLEQREVELSQRSDKLKGIELRVLDELFPEVYYPK